MTTVISYHDGKHVDVVRPSGRFICDASSFVRKHEGVWNGRVLAFVPTPHFSDGVPVASYEQFN